MGPVMNFRFFSVVPGAQYANGTYWWDSISKSPHQGSVRPVRRTVKDYELKFKNSKYNCRVKVILLNFWSLTEPTQAASGAQGELTLPTYSRAGLA